MTEAERLIEEIAVEMAQPKYSRDTRGIAYLIDRLITERLMEEKRKPKSKS